MLTRAAKILAFLAVVRILTGCGPSPEATYDYRWQILEAKPWQSSFRATDGESGIAFKWVFEEARRGKSEFNARVTLWLYPLDTILVVTKKKERLPEHGNFEVTRMYYNIRGNPLLFDVVVIPPQENSILLAPGKYFVHISPGNYSDVRIKEVEVKARHLSMLNVALTEQRFETN
jgi:hypothetical protein